MVSFYRVGFYLFVTTVFICGCAGGGGPSAPPLVTEPGSLTLLQQDDQSHEAQAAGHIPLIYASIYIDPTYPDDIKVEIAPLREAGMHLNILRFLEKSPCTDCFALSNIHVLPDGILSVDIEITHPWSHPNVTCFDVRGIIMFPWNKVFPAHIYQFTTEPLKVTTSDSTSGALVNADGYTTLYCSDTMGQGPNGLQGFEFGKYSFGGMADFAHVNGYKRHITDDPANTRNGFYAGSSAKVTYEMKLPSGPVYLNYCVDASWDIPLVDPVEDPMTDFDLDANCPEPWKIEASAGPIGSSGETALWIDIYDWQDPSNLSSVKVEAPDLFFGLKDPELVMQYDGYTQWAVVVPNEKGADAGQYPLLISAEDTENDPITQPWLDLRAYQIIMIEVWETLDEPPTAVAEANMYIAGIGDWIEFDASASHDNDEGGEYIASWEWDWNGDLNFVQEPPVTTHSWDTPGIYHLQLRVWDDEGSWDLLDEQIDIEILPSSAKGWVRTWIGSNWTWNNEVATDNSGNIYVVGQDIESEGASVLRKIDPDGESIWDLSWPTDSNIGLGDGIAIDSAGNIYVCGMFSGTVDFDPGPGEDIHTSDGLEYSYLTKFDPGGNFIWARTWGGGLYGGPAWWDRAHGVAVDQFDDVYVVGIFRGTCDFDPGPEVDEHISTGNNSGGFDAYITKFDQDGNHKWAHTWGDVNNGMDTGETVFGVATDSTSHIYVLGGFLGTVDFDPGAGVDEHTSTGVYGDVYLLKWSATGDFTWVKTWEAVGYCDYPGYNQMWGGSYLTADNSDNVLVTGFFTDTKDLDPGPGVQLEEGDAGYLSKFNSNGELLWVDTWPCSNLLMMLLYSVVADSADNVIMGGAISEEIDLDPGPGTDIRSPGAIRDAILVKLDPDGTYLWGRNWGSVNPWAYELVDSWGVATYGTSSIYVCGNFVGDVDFDPGPGSEIHSSDLWAGFLSKFLSDGSW